MNLKQINIYKMTSYNIKILLLFQVIKIIFPLIDNYSINNTINKYITKGEYSNLDNYLENLKQNNITFIDFLTENINNKLKKIKEISQKLSLISKTNFRIVSPAFNWRETEWDIFLEIFFSHRANAPSCGELDYQNIELLNNNMTFHFEGNCTMGDDELFFNLTLNLFKKVTKIKKIDQSRKQIQISLQKEKHAYWNRLLKNDEENPDNMNGY